MNLQRTRIENKDLPILTVCPAFIAVFNKNSVRVMTPQFKNN